MGGGGKWMKGIKGKKKKKVEIKKKSRKKAQWKVYNIKNGMVFKSYKKDKSNIRCSVYSETRETL